MANCASCILDGTDACARGAGRAVDGEICEKFFRKPSGKTTTDIIFEKGYEKGENDAKKECDTCLFSTRKEKVDEAYQQGYADAKAKYLDADAYNEGLADGRADAIDDAICEIQEVELMEAEKLIVISILEKIKEQKNDKRG